MKRLIILLLILNYSAKCQNWIHFGTGANNAVSTLFNDTVNHKLCIAGTFTQIDGINTRGIATWNGIQFDSMASGVDYLFGGPTGAKTMCNYNGRLCVGGVAKLGNVLIHGVGTWDGIAWDTLPEITNGSISCLQVNNGYLYACGYFTQAGSVITNSVAKWDGIHWSNVGFGFPYYSSAETPGLLCLKFYQGNLYAGGSFEDSAGNRMSIAKFNGVNWTDAGIHIQGAISDVSCMEVYNNELYIAGLFTRTDGNLDNGIIRFDGTNWKPVGGGFWEGAQVRQLKVIDGELYAVGAFYTAGGVPAQMIAKWDGTNWCSLGSVIDGIITSIEEYNNEIYIGGGFNIIDNDTMSCFSKWIGGNYTDSCGHLSVDINEQDVSNVQLAIYPNPASNQITLRLSEAATENTAIEIKNMLGQTLKSTMLPKGNKRLEIDVSGLPKGVYFIQLQTYGNIFSKKILKQ